MSRFTTIFWDVDDTLLDFPYSQSYALTKCFHSIGREVTGEMITRYAQINDSYWKRLELGEITKAELLTGRFITLFQEYGIQNVDVEAFRTEYQEGLGSVYRYKDNSLEVCRTLKGRVAQYVVTNGVAATQRKKLKLAGFLDIMDGVFISEEIGAPKPDRAFFDFCIKAVKEQDRSRILIVGDSLSSDIKGGIQAGIATCWYRQEGTPNAVCYKPDYEISNLQELLQMGLF